MNGLHAVLIGLLFGVGAYMAMSRNVVRVVLGLLLVSNAVNVFLLAAGRTHGTIPAYDGLAGVMPDALPQALVLTAIVVGAGALLLMTGLFLILARRHGSRDGDRFADLRR